MAKHFLSGEQAGILVHAIADRLDEVASAAGSTKPTNILIPITYSELVSLRDSGKLYPGATYRITDYKCSSSDANADAASNKFDILVKAINTNKLSEHCGALRNASDTYFPTVTDFDAWEVWYCLDNDTTRFGWASTNGKGVIYRLIDEFGNDCPYDFKNIMFKRTAEWFSKHEEWCNNVFGKVPTTERRYFTFSLANLDTLNGINLTINYYNGQKYLKFYQNKIAPYYSNGVQKLNGNVFILKSIDNTGCYANTFGTDCYSNTFGNGCHSNTFGNSCSSNTFGNNCHSNTFGNSCYSNTFGNGCHSNTFRNSCSYNTFGEKCSYNFFGNNCNSNTFGDNCAYNTFGNSCFDNIFGSSSTSLRSYYRYNCFEDGVQCNLFYTTQTTSSTVFLQNVTIHRGVKGSQNGAKLKIAVPDVNKNYNREYGRNSAGELKTWIVNL